MKRLKKLVVTSVFALLTIGATNAFAQNLTEFADVAFNPPGQRSGGSGPTELAAAFEDTDPDAPDTADGQRQASGERTTHGDLLVVMTLDK